MTIAPYPRDLIGYGGKPPAWKLPNGAKVAVSMVINFEEGAEMSLSQGDAFNEKVYEVTDVGAHPDEVLADIRALAAGG